MPLDLVILVDASNSVGKENFEYEVDFANDLISKFPISEEDTHAGVIDYSDEARPRVDINTDGTSKKKIWKRLYSLKNDYRKGKRDLVAGLKEADKMFSDSVRYNALRALVVLTSGPDINTIPSLEEPIKQLKDKPTKIIPISIGGKVPAAELEKIAKTPFHIKNVSGFPNLPGAAPDVAKLITGPGMCRFKPFSACELCNCFT